ncbi:MAG: hypothetical protein ACYDCK_10745 [Thermoplasmatota archaeon]
MRGAREPPGPSLPALRFPFVSLAWLVVTSALYLALEHTDGTLPQGLYDAVGFVPGALVAAPWRILVAPLALPFSHDPVQFAFVTASFALVVPYFEARHGWRLAALVFFVGSLASVAFVTLLVLAPFHALAPGNAAVSFTLGRAYFGGSVGVFAVVGALARRVGGLARWGMVAVALLWLAWELAFYYSFEELNSLFHLAAIPIGALLARRAPSSSGPE